MASSEPGMSADETSVLVEKETSHQIIKRINKLAESIKEQLSTIFRNPQSLEQHLKELNENTFHDPETAELVKLIAEKEKLDAKTFILEPKSFLCNANLQQPLEDLMKDTVKHGKELEYFLQRFDAFNEKIKSRLNTPLHYAGRNANLDFMKWLLEQPSIDVNARNETQKTVLSLLCDQFYYNPKDENVQNCILELVRRSKLDFNIYCGGSKLPFDLIMEWQSLDVLKKCEEVWKKCDQELKGCTEKRKTYEALKENCDKFN
uniref:(northern house mosquito) hypothetical protein n=2 Tax=Culex pipiens TaxID=7175 RepID=A0A8D8AQ74_CULPI